MTFFEIVGSEPAALRGFLMGWWSHGHTEEKALAEYAADPKIWDAAWKTMGGEWHQNDRGDWISADGDWVWIKDEYGGLSYQEQLMMTDQYEEEAIEQQKQLSLWLIASDPRSTRILQTEWQENDEAELANALENYTNPNHPEYDPEFTKQIKALRPDWFAEEK